MRILRSIIPGLVLGGLAGPAGASVVTFGSGPGVTTVVTHPHVEAGMTMTPLNTGTPLRTSHWDLFRSSFNGTSADWHAGIHTGDNAEEVEFTFGGAAFDLLSILIEGFSIDADNNGAGLTITFTSSSGGHHSITNLFGPGILDFAGISGFSNITSFRISAPLGVGECNTLGADCSHMGFDDVTFQPHVPDTSAPEPATLVLLGIGLAGIGVRSRCRGKHPSS